MADTDGQTPDHLIQELERDPFRFDFFRAVRLLQSRYSEQPRIGESIMLAQDPIRFGQNPSLAFAPSTIEALRPGPNGIPRLCVHFLGLFGPHSPLPVHLTEYARERSLHVGDNTLAGFFNIFHHRLISFFFRAWAANQKVVDLDRSDDQHFASYIGRFLGLGMDALRDRDAVPDGAKLYFSGRLVGAAKNAEGLEAILQDFFGIKTLIQTFVGRWMDLPSDSLCQLGQSPETGSLGVTTIVGTRFWECQLNFRIKLGPMRLADLERMLPCGSAFRRLRDWVLNYVGREFFWDVQLCLKADEVPTVKLGESGRLGWTTWLKTKPFTRDAEDLVLIPPGNH